MKRGSVELAVPLHLEVTLVLNHRQPVCVSVSIVGALACQPCMLKHEMKVNIRVCFVVGLPATL